MISIGNAFAFVLKHHNQKEALASEGSINPTAEFNNPTFEYIRERGTISATNGIIIDISTTYIFFFALSPVNSPNAYPGKPAYN